jgi:hypothetical protein
MQTRFARTAATILLLAAPAAALQRPATLSLARRRAAMRLRIGGPYSYPDAYPRAAPSPPFGPRRRLLLIDCS